MTNWASHWEHVVKTRQTVRMAVGKTSELRRHGSQHGGALGEGALWSGCLPRNDRVVRAGTDMIAHQNTQGTPFQEMA